MKKWTKIFLIITLLPGAFLIYLFWVTKLNEPVHQLVPKNALNVVKISDSLTVCGDSWLKLNKFGMWELFVQGDPYTMGLKNGRLTKNLVNYQEEAFVNQINQLVTSKLYLNFLHVFLGWFNRDLLKYVPLEYQLEVAGVSESASENFNYIAPPFQRIMSYHGAHDMGHALQSMCLVGCTSFGVWNKYSADSSLLIGRNFDFYAGDRFSENKIIAFMKPDEGHPFMSVTWGGMIGVVSGMNKEGLTITLNAEPTGIPTISKTPVSILARKILQYASTIDEAFKIAKEYETFVSESFLIGSAKENRVALIEKTPKKIVLYLPHKDYLTVTNHFQHPSLKPITPDSISQFKDASHYRFNRVEALIDSIGSFAAGDIASLLRDRKGENGINIGLGNEKSINQLIAHHGIIFKPKERKVWVAAAPFQLGVFVAYDLNKIFSNPQSYISNPVYLGNECIAEDPLLNSPEFLKFVTYKKVANSLKKGIEDNSHFTKKELDEFIKLNDNFYYPWYLVGNYYFKNKDYKLASDYFKMALKLEIPQQSEYINLVKLLARCSEKAK